MIPDYPYQQKREKLKPEGHSAWIESLLEPAVVTVSTLMSVIAVYVLAYDEIQRIFDGTATVSDWFVAALCVGLGFMVDMAIIISATRYKMHMVRNDHRERIWKGLALTVLIIGIVSEGLTLFYFFVSLSPSSYPPVLVFWANRVHGVLGVSRAFLPPAILAYFTAGILPVILDRGDRNRKIIAATSNNIMVLINQLSEVYKTDDKAEQLRALAGQMALATYAEYDRTDRTDEQEQMRRDSKLLNLLAGIHRLDWSAIGADVVPQLATHPTIEAAHHTGIFADEEAPTRPPTGGGTPVAAPAQRAAAASVRTDDTRMLEYPTRPRRQSAARARAPRSNGRPVRTAVERVEQAAEKRTQRLAQVGAWLAEDPAIATRELVRRLQAVEHSRISESTVTSLRREVEAGSNPAPSGQQFAQ